MPAVRQLSGRYGASGRVGAKAVSSGGGGPRVSGRGSILGGFLQCVYSDSDLNWVGYSDSTWGDGGDHDGASELDALALWGFMGVLGALGVTVLTRVLVTGAVRTGWCLLAWIWLIDKGKGSGKHGSWRFCSRDSGAGATCNVGVELLLSWVRACEGA